MAASGERIEKKVWLAVVARAHIIAKGMRRDGVASRLRSFWVCLNERRRSIIGVEKKEARASRTCATDYRPGRSEPVKMAILEMLIAPPKFGPSFSNGGAIAAT